MKLHIEIKEIEGTCPVYEMGDEFEIIDGYKLDTEIQLCTHSLTSLLPYYVPLSKGIEPKELGLGSGEKAYLQCLDPCDYTGGGTVIFEIKREKIDESN